jgi:ParB/RepB/Spo0J family partition protein
MTREIVEIMLPEIHADDSFNCRGQIVPIDVVDLAKDIEIRGLIQPVTVAPYSAEQQKETGYKYRLIAGFRRYTAHKVLGLPAIDSIVREDMTDEATARFFNLSENIQRQDLTILQEARALRRLKELGVSEHNAAEKLNKSRGWIQIRYMLLSLPVPVQKEVDAGFINQTQIRELFTLFKYGNEEKLYDAVRTIKEAKLRGRGDITVNPNKKKPTAKRHRKRAEIFDLMDHIQANIGNGLWTRCLAWAAGEISDIDLYESIAVHASDNEINYVKPPIEV